MKIFFATALILSCVTLEAQPGKICVMGSSTAYGHFILNGVQLFPRDSAWTFKIKKHYKDLGIIDTLFNIAASGNGPYHGMPNSYTPPPGRSQPYYPFNITKALQFFPRPTVLIVSYPSNQYDYLSKSEIIHCLQTIKDSANSAGIICYLTTSQPRDNFSPSERIKLKEIRDTIMHVFGPWAIDFFTDLADPVDYKIKPEFALGDGVHLNPAGHQVLMQKIISKNIFPSTVPVSLFNFSGKQSGNNSILLQWKTSSEINSELFIVQRSTDGAQFQNIGTVMAAGNSTIEKHYNFEDLTPLKPGNFYRLLIMHKNGHKQYSENLHINFSNSDLYATEIYPNPVQHFLKIDISVSKKSKAIIYIANAEGKILYTEKIMLDLKNTYRYNSAALKAGMYLLQIKTDTDYLVRPFIKL